MADFITPDKRSRIMSSIRGKNTSPEVRLRKQLWKEGLRGYRLHKNLPGKPDVIFTKRRLAVFVDGDFWHGHNWKKLGKVPPSGFWREKIRRNIERDKSVNKKLQKLGWRVVRFWEHKVNDNPTKCIQTIKKCLMKR